MFGHYTYLLYTVCIALPLAVVTWIYYWKIIKKELKLIIFVALPLVVYTGILWVYALIWLHVWWYSPDKILNITLFGSVVEDTIWWIIILLLQIPFILVFIKKQDNEEPLLKRE